jgi:maltooligosyltrehalose trehalohydrolase
MMSASGRRHFGAIPTDDGVQFGVFAPPHCDLRLHLLSGRASGAHLPVSGAGGVFEFFVPGARAGDRYAFTLDGSPHRPDPASRFQPEGVHGPSEIVDPGSYRWRNSDWGGCDPRDLVIYELHVGTFTSSGTFAGVRGQVGALRDLGITAIELMPIAEFAGARNWGYDGACPYAPSRNYGRPDDLRELIDAAHAAGIAVILDVVHNHLGPEGAYLTVFNPNFITDRHTTPWGGSVNLDGPGSDLVRSFIIDNVLHWFREYHLDGLRLDATHALIDTSPTHIVAELVDAVRSAIERPVMMHGEDHRNLATLVEPRELGGWGLDGVWADDFHHIVRRHLAGDAHAYFSDFEGTGRELAQTIQQGWLFTGQPSAYMKQRRGTDASEIPMRKFVVCLQNHDQVGNRAAGDRLHQTIDAAAWRAASTVLLTVPMTPVLFMGQEWAATTPFLYFTDLEPQLGRLVTEGRRQEFRHFPGFADRAMRDRIPDPQAPATFEASRLEWNERDRGAHQACLAMYTELLRLRRAHPALAGSDDAAGDASVVEDGALLIRREDSSGNYWVLVHLAGGACTARTGAFGNGPVPRVIFSTEDARFATDPRPPAIDRQDDRLVVRFERPGALILNLA